MAPPWAAELFRIVTVFPSPPGAVPVPVASPPRASRGDPIITRPYSSPMATVQAFPPPPLPWPPRVLAPGGRGRAEEGDDAPREARHARTVRALGGAGRAALAASRHDRPQGEEEDVAGAASEALVVEEDRPSGAARRRRMILALG